MMGYMVTKMINGQIHFSFVEITRFKRKLLIKRVKRLGSIYAGAN